MAEIRDGDAYSITIPDGARPCLVFPAGLFDKTHCPKDAKPLAAPPGVNPDSRVLGLGSVLAGDAGSESFATVIVTATQLADNAEPSDLREFARGMADGLVKSRHNATLRSGPEAQSLTIGGVHMVRITFDVAGLSEQGLDHVISYASWSKASDYNVTFMTAPAHAAAIDALADQTAATIHEAAPAPGNGSRLGHRVARVGIEIVGALAVPAIVWAIFMRSRRKGAGGPTAA
jgi:hypothetical protein